MSEKFLNYSAKYSLGIQAITLIVDILALQIDVPKDKIIVKQLLFLELIVQIIEGIFYIWLVKNLHIKDNLHITKYRYYDWILSTSIMLFTLICYIIHLQEPNKDIKQIYNENKETIIIVLKLNLLMMILGYFGESKKIKIKDSVFIGFIPFFIYYSIIFEKYVKQEVLDKKNVTIENQKQIKFLFWYFFIFWGFYGLAALLPFQPKNISYNILDLFSKNFFGIFLSYIVYVNKI
jgi:bacteriorhodopsin